MSKSKTITVDLPPDFADMVDEALASGRYTSERDFICHALALMKLVKLYEQGVVSRASLQSSDPVAELARNSTQQWQDIL